MTPPLVLFDCDGTLVDSGPVIVAAMAAAFAAHGLPAPPAVAVRQIIGLSLPLAVARLTDGHDGAPTDAIAAAYALAYRDAVGADAGHEPLFPGIAEALDALAETATLGVVTGKSRRGLDRILAAHRLTDRFAVTVTADDAASKPAPDMVHLACRRTGIAPARSVVVGDTAFDIRMARAAGAAAIGVAWGYHPVPTLEAAGAHAIAAAAADLPGLVAAVLEAA